MGRVDGQQHEEAHSHADDDAQQSGQHTGDGVVEVAVGKFFLVHLFALLSLLACAGHVEAQLLHSGGLGVELAHDLALVHDEDAVG